MADIFRPVLITFCPCIDVINPSLRNSTSMTSYPYTPTISQYSALTSLLIDTSYGSSNSTLIPISASRDLSTFQLMILVSASFAPPYTSPEDGLALRVSRRWSFCRLSEVEPAFVPLMDMLKRRVRRPSVSTERMRPKRGYFGRGDFS